MPPHGLIGFCSWDAGFVECAANEPVRFSTTLQLDGGFMQPVLNWQRTRLGPPPCQLPRMHTAPHRHCPASPPPACTPLRIATTHGLASQPRRISAVLHVLRLASRCSASPPPHPHGLVSPPSSIATAPHRHRPASPPPRIATAQHHHCSASPPCSTPLAQRRTKPLMPDPVMGGHQVGCGIRGVNAGTLPLMKTLTFIPP
ncbi:hypothetical protein PM3016_763 [Paenibacillus mucilaginosus 3016]|uniref:Uncharacterized protein n=1 Tax=Paenibacillus mucilaginosus 3016 TaxID=1116391 RepID=H6N8X1_9BACL|nr:hypothetical protein PM3016_763 [Paenibacillus mucilaginosus 3016]